MEPIKLGDKVKVTDRMVSYGYTTDKFYVVVEVPREFYGGEVVTIINDDGEYGDFYPEEYERVVE